MRGKHEFCRTVGALLRNIPAYAGKTKVRAVFACQALGTSPRMRGKLEVCTPSAKDSGNIPAYAGKTLRNSRSAPQYAEHPRVCGENQQRARLYLNLGGTSPRMRGKPTVASMVSRPKRNIPAYAGKTTLHHSAKWSGAEHPRVCGENYRC